MVNSGAWIETFSGRRFYPLDPRAKDICVEDIAHALSMLCRFTGHVKTFYSVAEHCVRVSRTCDADDALYGLLHDASEAYIADMSRPLKYSLDMKAYRDAERHIMLAVTEHFGLPSAEPASIKLADNILLVTEKRDLMPESPEWAAFAEFKPLATKIVPWSPARAEREFLNRFDELTGSRMMSSFANQADGWREYDGF